MDRHKDPSPRQRIQISKEQCYKESTNNLIKFLIFGDIDLNHVASKENLSDINSYLLKQIESEVQKISEFTENIPKQICLLNEKQRNNETFQLDDQMPFKIYSKILIAFQFIQYRLYCCKQSLSVIDCIEKIGEKENILLFDFVDTIENIMKKIEKNMDLIFYYIVLRQQVSTINTEILLQLKQITSKAIINIPNDILSFKPNEQESEESLNLINRVINKGELLNFKQNKPISLLVLNAFSEYQQFKNCFFPFKQSGIREAYVFTSISYQEKQERSCFENLSEKESFISIKAEKKFNRLGFIVHVDKIGMKHWIFISAYIKRRKIRYYDSERTKDIEVKKELIKGVKKFLNDHFKGQQQFEEDTEMDGEKFPNQEANSNDCGVFVMKFMQNFYLDEPQNFEQKDIKSLRENLYDLMTLFYYQLSIMNLKWEELKEIEFREKDKYSRNLEEKISQQDLNHLNDYKIEVDKKLEEKKRKKNEINKQTKEV